MYEAFFLYYKFNVVIFYSIKLDIVIFILNRERTFIIKKKKKKGQFVRHELGSCESWDWRFFVF